MGLVMPDKSFFRAAAAHCPWFQRRAGRGRTHSRGPKMKLVLIRLGHVGARDFSRTTDRWSKYPLNRDFPVVGTGVDPVTSRFSGARSTN